MDYSKNDSVDPPEPGQGSGDSWNDIEQLLEKLEQDREHEQEIIGELIEDIESELDRVHDVYDTNVSQLEESISGQKDRLQTAKTGAGEDEKEVRSRLARLYEELRQERREELENRLELKMLKWEMQRELRELENVDELDLE